MIVVELQSEETYKRVSMSHVPAVGETIRILRTVEGMCSASYFRVTRVIHNASTSEYPRRDGELDAWVSCVMVDA